jgi:hypothetical protein
MPMYGKVYWLFEVFFWLHKKADNFDMMVSLIDLDAPLPFAMPFFRM